METSNEVMRAGLRKALCAPFKLMMFGLGTAGAALADSWLLLGLAALGYAVSLALDLSRQDFWREVVETERRRTPPLPDPDTLFEGEARAALYRLQEGVRCLERAAPPSGAKEGFRERVVALEQEVVRLVGALQRLDRFMGDHPLGGAEWDARATDQSIAEAGESRVHRERLWHHRVAHDRLREIEEADADRRLLVARLKATVGTLEALACRLARPELSGDLFADGPRQDLVNAVLEPGEWAVADTVELDDAPPAAVR